MTPRTTALPTRRTTAGAGLSARWSVALEERLRPRESGLPRLAVLLAFPVVVVIVAAVAVFLGVSGTSSGIFWGSFGTGSDPDLLAGMPRGVRSDEWLVQSSWILSQVAQGFPQVNQTLPGGMDATIQNDLPVLDWSTLFRPHVWGFFVASVDQGMAWRWWLPAVAVLVSCYAFVVTLLPRRPVTAALLAFAVVFSPVLQWWFLPITLWPVAWAFTALTAVVWSLRTHRRWVRVAVSAAAAYLTVTMTMSIYVPFMIPSAYVVAFVGVGFIVATIRGGTSFREVAGRLAPLLVAVVVAAGVLGVWIVTRLGTLESVLSTVYPGQRLEPTGTTGFPQFVQAWSAPFQQAVQTVSPGVLGSNASESAAPLMVSLPALVVVAWLVLHDRRRAASVDPVLVALFAVQAFFVLFLFVPGWDSLAHALFIDRTTASRLRIGFDLLNVVSVAYLGHRLDREGIRLPWAVALLAGAVSLGPIAVAWATFHFESTELLTGSRWWMVVCLLVVLVPVALARRRLTTAAAMLAVAAVIVGAGVNPLYRGVFELTDTEAGRDVVALEKAAPDSTWVGVGGYVTTAMLLESGVRAYNGVQTYPPEEMWDEIDPGSSDADAWNRLANVFWAPGSGEPEVTNPVRDQIQVTFDGCSEFAEEHVDYVLADQALDTTCLRTLDTVTQGTQTLWIYEVDDARAR